MIPRAYMTSERDVSDCNRRSKRRPVWIVALQQHFGNPGGGAEVAVNLERRVGVEQVRIEPSAPAVQVSGGRFRHGLKQVFQDLVGVISI